ncbi:MAG: aminotransferase [Blastopirellula sp.]|nr:MAG: aminotransferase [Blastopirellula sp.]
MPKSLRYLLIQIRNADDPIREQERACFAAALECDEDQIRCFDLLSGPPTHDDLNSCDMVLVGGSGDYSVVSDEPWLLRALEGFQLIHEVSKPTFGSCWGFQVMARAIGGRVIHDLEHAELGTKEIMLTTAGMKDPVFSQMDNPFLAYMGHEDRVIELPLDAELLASTELVENQAFRFIGKPIYCTQFHPELNYHALLGRMKAYPKYCEKIAGVSFDEFVASFQEAKQSEGLMRLFRKEVFGV